MLVVVSGNTPSIPVGNKDRMGCSSLENVGLPTQAALGLTHSPRTCRLHLFSKRAEKSNTENADR